MCRTIPNKMPHKRKQPDPALLEDILLRIKFPRCSVCELDWFLDGDGSLYEKCKRLLPMPPCKCTSVFISKSLDCKLDDIPNKDHLGKYFVQQYCIPDNLKRVNRICMCNSCLENFIRTSDDVIEHDYMSETQPNQKFSVGGRCVICQQRFTPRSLASIRNYNHTTDEMTDFLNCIQYTIEWIGNRKRLLRRMKQSDDSPETLYEYSAVNNWLRGTDGNESDECFSEDEIMVDITKSQHRRDGVIAPESGEMKQHLLERDPLFKQECEDFEYIQQMSRTKEGRLELGIESDEHGQDLMDLDQLKRDEAMARKLQRLEHRVAGPRSRESITRFLEIVPMQSKIASTQNKKESVTHEIKVLDSGIKKFLFPKPAKCEIVLSDSDDSFSITVENTQTEMNNNASRGVLIPTTSSLLQDSSNDKYDKDYSSQHDVLLKTKNAHGSEVQQKHRKSSSASEIHLLDDSSEEEKEEKIPTISIKEQHNESDVNMIMQMGFSVGDAKRALQMANYNRILAINILLDENLLRNNQSM